MWEKCDSQQIGNGMCFLIHDYPEIIRDATKNLLCKQMLLQETSKFASQWQTYLDFVSAISETGSRFCKVTCTGNKQTQILLSTSYYIVCLWNCLGAAEKLLCGKGKGIN